MVWDTQPAPSGFSAGAAANAQTISYSSGANPPGWVMWDLSDAIHTAVLNAQPIGVVWAATNESTQGWAYFAKKEYGVAYQPTLVEVWDVPVVLTLTLSPTNPAINSPVTATVSVNGIGLGNGTNNAATVAIQAITGNPTLPNPPQLTVDGYHRTFTFYSGTSSGSIRVTYNSPVSGQPTSATASYTVH
jgi:hypothetical protein